MIRTHFELVPDGEYSIEIDPRKVSRESVHKLGKLGFNRMSVGIQDFDPKVQAAVNRIQSVEETRTVIEAARESGFKSVSVDLIYGLPHQSVNSIRPTLDTVLSLAPDRIALYHYAHLDKGELPVMRGFKLGSDDIVRRNIIQDLMCRFALDFADYEGSLNQPFAQYFADEMRDLQKLAGLGLVEISPDRLAVTAKGRFLIRNIAMVFDYYLRHQETRAKYSQTV